MRGTMLFLFTNIDLIFDFCYGIFVILLQVIGNYLFSDEIKINT